MGSELTSFAAMNPNGQFLLAAAGDRKMVESTEQGQDGVVVHAIG